MNELSFKRKSEEITFESFDQDKELGVAITHESGLHDRLIYLSPNQINSVIMYLAEQLKEIGEPVELITKLQATSK